MRTAGCMACLAFLLGVSGLYAETPKQFVQQAVAAELHADQSDHSVWLFYDDDRKASGAVEQWVAETQKGAVHRILKKNGAAQSEAQQRAQVNHFVRSAAAQSKERAAEQHDAEQARTLLKLLPDAFVWTSAGTQGKDALLHFKPDPNYQPPNHEAEVLAAMEGELVVDQQQHRIASIKGRLSHDIKFGWGLLGKIRAGGTFDVERREVGNEHWHIVQTHVHIRGHILFFKTISEQEDDAQSKFKQLPENISFEQAEQELMKQPE